MVTVAPRTRLARSPPARANLLLVVLGVALLALYGAGLRAKTGDDIKWFIPVALCQAALYLIAAVVITHARAARSTLVVVIVFAALFRLAVLCAPPYLSDDVYRYVWDGRVQAAGINPYRYVPADEALAALRDDAIYPEINRRDYARTIYPPAAQMIYWLTTRVSERVAWMRVVMVGCEAAALYALTLLLASCGLPRQRVLLCAWHPLLVWEIAGSGHVDAAALAFICLALLARRRERDTATGVWLACAVLVKLYPLVLFPALYRRRSWRMPLAFAAAIVVAYLPYLGVGVRGALGFLPGYAAEEGLRDGTRFFLLACARELFGGARVPGGAYVVFALVMMGALGAWALGARERDERAFIDRAFVLAAAFTLLLSPRYAWYYVWLVPFVCLLPPRRVAAVCYATLACFLLYHTWQHNTAHDQFVLNAQVILPALAVAALVWLTRRPRRPARPAVLINETSEGQL
ncbi:MAG: DUF2029 domain-containing protein [Acidobacteria bacterium]|nr:DUF2029 domain-containing protein [Acidobacteriota bacterium]